MDEDHLARLQVVFRIQSAKPPEMGPADGERLDTSRDLLDVRSAAISEWTRLRQNTSRRCRSAAAPLGRSHEDPSADRSIVGLDDRLAPAVADVRRARSRKSPVAIGQIGGTAPPAAPDVRLTSRLRQLPNSIRRDMARTNTGRIPGAVKVAADGRTSRR